MKKFKPDPVYFKQSAHVLAIILIAIAFYNIITHLGVVFGFLAGVFGAVYSVLVPFVYGALIAFILNPIGRRLELILLKPKFMSKRPRIPRFLATVVSFAAIIGMAVWMVSYLLPDISRNIAVMVDNITALARDITGNPEAAAENELLRNINDILTRVNELTGQNFTLDYIVGYITRPLAGMTGDMPQLASLAGRVLGGTISVAGTVLNAILGIIIAFYFTLEKEGAARVASKFVNLVFKEKTADKIFAVAKDANNMFEKFFTGKLLDSLCIGLIFYVVAQYIIKLDYAIFFALVIGVTNMIPYFGPFIGGIPVALFVMLGDVTLGLWTGLTILILQQFDGNILGPLILGDSTGVKPLEVIFAIIVGGAVFGVLGMFFGVPLYAVIKTTVSGLIDKHIEERGKQAETGLDEPAPD